MRSRKAPASTARRFHHHIAGALALVLLLAICAAAQQPKRVPRLTTEDVTQPVAATSTIETKDAKPTDAKAATGKPEVAKDEGAKKEVSPDEVAWRERVAQAQEKAKALEKATEEAELRITALRNELGISGRGAQDRNQTAADLETAGQRFNELRKQSRDANADLKDLLAYGKEKGYSEADGPKATTDDGKANEEYYRSKFAILSEEIETAERRMALYENRIRDLQQRILNNGSGGPGKKGGDNFTTSQFQHDKEEAQRSFDDAQAARQRAMEKRDALIEAARHAGVAPGVLR